MRRFLALLLAAGSALGTSAQPVDNFDSPECTAAREELEATFDDPAVGRDARAQRLAAVRKKAWTACLGPMSALPQRSGAPQPAVVVPAPIISARPLYAPVPAPPAPLPPVAVPRPAVVTTCDPAGCWDSEGRRLNNLGPMLVGPRGVCTLQGGIANCP